jgi:hypothetical protein
VQQPTMMAAKNLTAAMMTMMAVSNAFFESKNLTAVISPNLTVSDHGGHSPVVFVVVCC